MSVPHILADESSAYYHAYVLAEMSVHQTRAHFKRKYGEMVDNPKVSSACLHRVYVQFMCTTNCRQCSVDCTAEHMPTNLDMLVDQHIEDPYCNLPCMCQRYGLAPSFALTMKFSASSLTAYP